MPVIKFIEDGVIGLSLPSNLSSRTVFRFYAEDNNGNNSPLTGFTSANFVIYPVDQPAIDIEMTCQANGDVILYLAASALNLDKGLYDCSIFLDNDYVPFVSGQIAFGIVIQPNQTYGIMNASRNAVLINGDQFENPQYIDSESVRFIVELDSDGVATISLDALLSTTLIYDKMKAILQSGSGIAIVPDDAEQTLTVEAYP